MRRLAVVGGFGLLAASTASSQTYCNSGASSQFDTNIGLVQLNTINNNTAGICATYSNFTNISTTLILGNPYSVSVLAGTCGGNFTKYGKVYIDYNRDGDWVDPGEEVYGFGPGSAPQTFTGNFTVPLTAIPGSTRMRVIVMETFSLANVTPCTPYTFGETEDYTIILGSPQPNDMGVTNVTGIASACGLTTSPVTVTVTNYGTNAQSAWNVSYRVNGGPIVTEPMAVSLASGASTVYNFITPANVSAPGLHVIKAWTSLASDGIAANDTASTQVINIPYVTTYPYIEGFETYNGGWVPGGTLSSWAWGTPAKNVIIGAATGTKAYVTGGLGQSDYNNSEDSHILGPCFDFTSLTNPWISFYIWWQAETGWDGTNLQYSTNNGASWTNVGAFGDPGNWYNDNGILSTPGNSGEGWTGSFSGGQPPSSGTWVRAAHALPAVLAGQSNVKLRFTFGADGSVTDDGIAIDEVRIGEGPRPQLPGDTLICGGDSLFLTPGNFSSYQWSTGAQTAFDTIHQGNVGSIWVRVVDTNAFFGLDTMVVLVSNPLVNIGPDSSICPGDTVLLDAGSHPGGSFLWSDNTTNQTAFITTAGTHHVLVTDSVGCQKTDTMVVNVLIPPTISLGNDTTVCVGTPVVLDGGPGPTGTTYQWNNGSQTQIIIVTSPGLYRASVTTPGGCAAIDSVVVSNFPSPAINLGPNRVECGPYVLDAGPGGTSYLWSTSANTQTISSSAPGTYSATVTNQFGCFRSDTVLITMSIPPTVSLGPDQVLCNGLSISLNAGNPGMTYLWSNASTSQSITVNTAGNYFVAVTNAQGCVGTDTVFITSSPLTVNLGPNVNMCGGQAVVLDAGNPGSTYTWSNSATTQLVSVNQVGTYSVTVTDNIGCTATDAITVGQVPGVTAAISAPATGALLQPVNFTDQSTGGANQWFWDFGDGLTSIQQNPTHTFQAFGVYTVTLIATDGNCRDTTTTTITINSFVGVEDDELNQTLQLWPNPSNGVFHLTMEFQKPRAIEMEITDLSGKVVLGRNLPVSMTVAEDLDLTGLAKGIYVLRIKAGDSQAFHKLVLH